MRWIFVVTLLCWVTPVSASTVTTPQAIVARFLELMDRDPAAAATMLDPTAMWVSGHVGGPMRGENPLLVLGCLEQEPPKEGEPVNLADTQASQVLSDWLCPIKGTHTARPFKATFVVKGDRILGASLEVAEYTVPWPKQVKKPQ